MLEKIERKILSFVGELESQSINAMFGNMQSGKMLRSKLMLAICNQESLIVTLCAIVEMIQSASLLHDDVIDDSLLRRGKASINAIFGNKNAVMLGDILYAKAFYELTKLDRSIAQSLADCVVRLSRGEIHDVMMGENFQDCKQEYFAMIEDKTAALIASSARCAAILANLDDEKYYNYGINLGMAFQIVDDMLDVFGDSKTLGKPAMSDFVEGKTTLPYLLLYEALSLGDKEILQSFFKCDTQEARDWILEKMQVFGIFEKSQNIAKDFGKKALHSIKDEHNDKLEKIIQDVIFREF